MRVRECEREREIARNNRKKKMQSKSDEGLVRGRGAGGEGVCLGWETGRGTVQQNQRSTIDNFDEYYRLLSTLSCSTSLGQVEANDIGFRLGVG